MYENQHFCLTMPISDWSRQRPLTSASFNLTSFRGKLRQTVAFFLIAPGSLLQSSMLMLTLHLDTIVTSFSTNPTQLKVKQENLYDVPGQRPPCCRNWIHFEPWKEFIVTLRITWSSLLTILADPVEKKNKFYNCLQFCSTAGRLHDSGLYSLFFCFCYSLYRLLLLHALPRLRTCLQARAPAHKM